MITAAVGESIIIHYNLSTTINTMGELQFLVQAFEIKSLKSERIKSPATFLVGPKQADPSTLMLGVYLTVNLSLKSLTTPSSFTFPDCGGVLTPDNPSSWSLTLCPLNHLGK